MLRRGAPLPDADALGAPPQRLPGVTTPALRVGQWRALSPLRTEESGLYALCYLHSGRLGLGLDLYALCYLHSGRCVSSTHLQYSSPVLVSSTHL